MRLTEAQRLKYLWMTNWHWAALSMAADGLDLRECSEPLRQKLIDLGMHNRALVTVDGDLVSITPAGRAALDKRGGE